MNAMLPGTLHHLVRPAPQHAVLTRTLIADGGAARLAAQDAPDLRLFPETERAASLAASLRRRPAGDLWVFGYGSLIWNPGFKSVERRIARIDGWHRAFCLSMPAGRGTPGAPGLALGLDRGGSCQGMAYRVAEEDIESELPILWDREMLLGGYIPQWVELLASNGRMIGHAITFVINTGHDLYAGDRPCSSVVECLATAAGNWGSSADYLFRTRDALRLHGIPDTKLENLGALVEAVLAGLELAKVA
ncbi:cation transport protein ChaC [Sphingomonas leidyi]|uniref:glutathione-specific gamma-glutamylcyclotransferase n=1 Tax=Sphingomonas leidyi TaxID=68569 RepID=A0A7X5UXY8_9SPHN|nr:gamma-glutamylcyclotransferase [Sphingomonas leidyi]NIJ64236.1 cation transport protein ChaC [Sphingomonas leidyi]